MKGPEEKIPCSEEKGASGKVEEAQSAGHRGALERPLSEEQRNGPPRRSRDFR